MGLREIKKKRARTAILDAARELFFSLGYDGTTVEAIAGKAEVAVGTVYNYFDSKSSVILALTENDTSTVRGAEFPISGSDSGLEVLRRYLHSFMEGISKYPRQLLRELIREALGGPGSILGEGLTRQDITLLEDLRELLGRLRSSGMVRRDLDLAMASMIVYGTVMTSLLWYAADPGRTSVDMLGSMDGMLQTLCSGLEPKGAGK
jgi:AcrR family transcriptional regulator